MALPTSRAPMLHFLDNYCAYTFTTTRPAKQARLLLHAMDTDRNEQVSIMSSPNSSRSGCEWLRLTRGPWFPRRTGPGTRGERIPLSSKPPGKCP